MANPYHDEIGKFCSRNEMLQAIDRQMISGNTKKYLELRAEMDEIEADVIHVKEEDIASLLEKKTFATTEDEVSKITNPELLNLLVKKVLKDKEKAPEWEAYNARLVEAYHHPNVTEEIKENILGIMDSYLAGDFINHKDTSAAQKEELFREYSDSIELNTIQDYLTSGAINDADVAKALKNQSEYSTFVNIATPEMWDTPAGKEMFINAIQYPIESHESFLKFHYTKPTAEFLAKATASLPNEDRRNEAIVKLENVGYPQDRILKSLAVNPATTENEIKHRLIKIITNSEISSNPDSKKFPAFTLASKISKGMKEDNQVLKTRAEKYSYTAASLLQTMGSPTSKEARADYEKEVKTSKTATSSMQEKMDKYVRITALERIASLHKNPRKDILAKVQKGSRMHNDIIHVLTLLAVRDRI